MLVLKSANVTKQDVDDSEMKLINALALSTLAKEDVFTFKIAMCDNEVDRDYECFPISTLTQLKDMYVGKTVIKDHEPKSENQVARIYFTELVRDETRTTKNKEVYTQLVAHCYMLKTSNNADLIKEIQGGIKKEVSVGLATNKVVCSICGKDNSKEPCSHLWGKVYNDQLCYFKLEEAVDAYEVSFVAVPAQPKAGTVKNYRSSKSKDVEREEEDMKEDLENEEIVEDEDQDVKVEDKEKEIVETDDEIVESDEEEPVEEKEKLEPLEDEDKEEVEETEDEVEDDKEDLEDDEEQLNKEKALDILKMRLKSVDAFLFTKK